jgi:hypothetical protein
MNRGYPLPRRHELGVIGAGDTRQLAAVNQLLPAPGVDALRADIQIMRDPSNWPASLDKVQNFPPELSRVPPGHIILRVLLDGDHPATRLRRTGGTSAMPLAFGVRRLIRGASVQNSR